MVVLAAEARPWEEAAAVRGWRLLQLAPVEVTDAGVKTVQGAVEEYKKHTAVDATRVYLVGAGPGAAAVFYLAARAPEMWAAALAVEGSPRAAIDTNRLFAANTQWVPVLWVSSALERPAMPGYNLEPRAAGETTLGQALEWLGSHQRDPFPAKVDCETGNPELARCYWVEMRKLDFSRRNDVLGSSRVRPGSGAALELGGFGFNPGAAGPGLAVSWLPENYQGPLKLGDRIVAVGGTEIANGRAYLEHMNQANEEKRVVVVIQRGKRRERVETRIVLRRREEVQTARVQAEYLADAREVLIISRGVEELRLTLPHYWVPCPINWNGTAAGTADAAGCWAVAEGGRVKRCE